MTTIYETDQENFWAGEFGNEYTARNLGDKKAIASRLALWAAILQHIPQPVRSILELGANIGINLDALLLLQPEAKCSAVEINAKAVEFLKRKQDIQIFHESILTFNPKMKWDFVFSSGVMIHISPNELPKMYKIMADCADKYICIAEYYSPYPVEVEYRGHKGKLFKRDFAGDFLRHNPEFSLLKYGFVYHGDQCFPADDITWFLLQKQSRRQA